MRSDLLQGRKSTCPTLTFFVKTASLVQSSVFRLHSSHSSVTDCCAAVSAIPRISVRATPSLRRGEYSLLLSGRHVAPEVVTSQSKSETGCLFLCPVESEVIGCATQVGPPGSLAWLVDTLVVTFIVSTTGHLVVNNV